MSKVHELIGLIYLGVEDGKISADLAKNIIAALREIGAGPPPPQSSSDALASNVIALPTPDPNVVFIPKAPPKGGFAACKNECGVMTGNPDRICNGCREKAD